MKKVILIILCIFSLKMLNAQTTQYNGYWALCKVVTPKGDTQKIAITDARYITYEFTYNNTFTSTSRKYNEECTGRWGYEFKTKAIKIKKPVLTKSKKVLEDYDIIINQVTDKFFVEARPENKKETSYYIYCRTK